MPEEVYPSPGDTAFSSRPEDPCEGKERRLVDQRTRGTVGGERTASSRLSRRFRHSRRLEALLKVRKGVLDAASQTLFTDSESDVRHSAGVRRGLELDCGKLWRRKSPGAGVNQPEDPCEGRERLLVDQPEDPWEERTDPCEGRERLVDQPEDLWEVRERLLRGFRGVSVTAGGWKRCCPKGRHSCERE